MHVHASLLGVESVAYTTVKRLSIRCSEPVSKASLITTRQRQRLVIFGKKPHKNRRESERHATDVNEFGHGIEVEKLPNVFLASSAG